MSGRIPEHKLNALAHMTISGFDAEKMAQITNLTVETVRGILKREDPRFKALKEAHEQKLLQSQVLHVMEFQEMQQDCYQAIRNAIQGQDKRLAAEQSWKVLDTLHPRKREPDAPLDVNINVRAQADFTKTIIDMGQQFVELKQVLATQDPNKHVLTGAEALPQAVKALPKGEPDVVNERVELPPGDDE